MRNSQICFGQREIAKFVREKACLRQVADDTEIQEWWRDVREKGHPDKKEGWPELRTRNGPTGHPYHRRIHRLRASCRCQFWCALSDSLLFL